MTFAQYKKKIDKFIKEVPDAIESAILTGAEIVRTEAVVNHLSGPKMARGQGSLTKGTLAVKSGDLRSSVRARAEKRGNGITGIIGSNQIYSRIHEHGGMTGKNHAAKIPARPYLSSSLKVKKSKVLAIILRQLMEGYKKSGR